jgi:hypothetical protein
MEQVRLVVELAAPNAYERRLMGCVIKGYGLHVDEPNGKPPGLDNYNDRTRQTINVVEYVVDRDTDDLRIVLEPRGAAPRR